MALPTAANLLQLAADVTEVDIAALPALWTRNAAAALDLGIANLTGFLSTAGYSAAQLAEYDQQYAWSLSQGMYELAGYGKGFGESQVPGFDRFDVIKKLTEQKQWALLIGGVPRAPDGTSEVGGIASGSILGCPTPCGPTCGRGPWWGGLRWPGRW